MLAIWSPTWPTLGLTVHDSPHDFQKKSCGGLQTRRSGSKPAQAGIALPCAWGLATPKSGREMILLGLPHFHHHSPKQGCSLLSPAVITQDLWSKTAAAAAAAGRGEGQGYWPGNAFPCLVQFGCKILKLIYMS